MHEIKVSVLGTPFETSCSALPVRPISLAGCYLPWSTVLGADTAGAVQRGGEEPRYRQAGSMRWENLPEIQARHRHRHRAKLGGPASSPATISGALPMPGSSIPLVFAATTEPSGIPAGSR